MIHSTSALNFEIRALHILKLPYSRKFTRTNGCRCRSGRGPHFLDGGEQSVQVKSFDLQALSGTVQVQTRIPMEIASSKPQRHGGCFSCTFWKFIPWLGFACDICAEGPAGATLPRLDVLCRLAVLFHKSRSGLRCEQPSLEALFRSLDPNRFAALVCSLLRNPVYF